MRLNKLCITIGFGIGLTNGCSDASFNTFNLSVSFKSVIFKDLTNSSFRNKGLTNDCSDASCNTFNFSLSFEDLILKGLIFKDLTNFNCSFLFSFINIP